jgi:hypothetical protein
MAGRYSYSNSPYQMDELAMYQRQYQQQLYAMQSGPRRFISAVGRFFYRLVVLALIAGAVGGVLFALYRNDILVKIARDAGVEAQYKSLEKALPASWGPPRSVDVPAESALAAPVAAAPATNDDGSSKGDTVQAIAASEPKAKTRDGLEIVSFDSLPTAPTKRGAATASLSEVPAAAPPAPATASRPEPVKVARAEPAPVRERQQPKREKKKAEPAKPTELTRSIPLPKPKPEPQPEPVAKAEPKPEPPPKPAPEEDHTKARASDNPLKAAIRASMAAKKSD